MNTPQFRGCDEPYIPPLGTHVSISTDNFPTKLSSAQVLRLTRLWIAASTPRTVFKCDSLTLEGT